MGTFLKNLWTDQTMFFGMLRAAIGTVGVLAETGKLDALLSSLPPTLAAVVGPLLIAGAWFMRSSSSPSVPEVAKP